MNNADFSSWPPHQEQSFAVYEQTRAQSQRKAWTIGAAVAAVFFFLLLGISLAVEPKKVDMTKDMNMSNITKKAATPAK
jgi:arginine exporter protein ArgO